LNSSFANINQPAYIHHDHPIAMALNSKPKSRRFERDENIYVGGSIFNHIGRDQAIYYRAPTSTASTGTHGPDIALGSHSRDARFSFVSIPEELETDPIPNINISSDVNSQSDGTLTPVSVPLDDVHPASPDKVFPTVPHGPDIALGSHSHDTRFGFVLEPEELETDPIPNINIPSDVNAQSDGTLTPVSVSVPLDNVHPASQDEVFPTVTLSEHNTEPSHNGVVLLDSLHAQPAFAEPTNPRPTFVYVLDGTALTATLTPSHPSDAIEALNAEAEAREARLRQGRIERRTNNTVNWLQRTYGSNDGLQRYMNQFPASDIIRRSCTELRELCGM
jgi:hypothetical protein